MTTLTMAIDQNTDSAMPPTAGIRPAAFPDGGHQPDPVRRHRWSACMFAGADLVPVVVDRSRASCRGLPAVIARTHPGSTVIGDHNVLPGPWNTGWRIN
jgi:hypothetical protein